MPDPIDTARAFVAAISAADLAAMRALMTGDYTFTDALGRSFSGADMMIAGWKHFFAAYPGYWIRVDAAFADGPRVALFGEAGGQWKVGDRILPDAWSVPAAWLAEIEDSKVKTWTIYCDTAWATPPVKTDPPAEGS